MVSTERYLRRGVALAGIGLLIGGLTAGCGSSSKTSAPPTTAVSPSTASGPPTTTPSSGTSGSGSKARAGQTIEIEVVTTEKGVVSIPQFREGTVAAADYINQHGGVDGAKLKLDICSSDSTPEGSLACANDAIDHHVPVDYIATDLALDASVPKLAEAGIPVVMDYPAGAVTASNPDVRVESASAPALIIGPLKYFASQSGAKNFGVITIDVPAGREEIGALAGPLAAAMKSPVKVVYLNQTNPNYTATILELKAAHVQAVYAGGSEGECSSLVAAAKNLNFTGTLVLGGCTQFIQTDGANADGIYLTSPVFPYVSIANASPAIKSQLQTYASAMTAAGFGSDVSSGDGLIGYAGFADLVTALQAIPASTAVTASSVKAAVNSTKFIGFTGIPIDCSGTNSIKPDETACSSAFSLVKVVKGGASPTIVPVGAGIFSEGAFLKTVFP